MNQLAVREDNAVVAADANSIMEVISRAAADPKTDVDKLERLLNMYERITAQRSKAAYTQALATMQPTLPVITERGGITNNAGKVQSTYALWEDINDAIKPILAEHGFALSFRTGQADGKIIVTGVLSHRDGHSEETTMHLPVDSSGSKNAVQAVGSSTSYGKRYTAQALLNLTSRGGDDDGKAGGGGLVSDEQIQAIKDLIARSKADKAKFCAHFKIEDVRDLLARDYTRAVEMLNMRGIKNAQDFRV